MEKKIKILFVGIPDMALVCLDALKNNNKEIVGIVAPPKNHDCFGIMLEKARQYDIPFLVYDTLKDRDFLKKVKDLKPDIGVVCSFDRLIPKNLLEIPKHGFINVHPSLLPEYRGGNPYFHVIKNMETKTGVTIHFMDETFDTGDMIAQASMPIGEFETMGTLFNKLNLQSSLMLNAVISMFEQGNTPYRTMQDKETSFKKAPGIDPQKGNTVVDWSWPVEKIESFIRACNPFYGTISYYRGETFRLYCAGYKKKNVTAKLGEIVEVEKESFGIAARDGVIYPEVIYFGSYAIADVKTFIDVFAPKAGEMVI